MRIAVVGAKGFIGSNLSAALCNAGHCVLPITRQDPLEFKDIEVVYHCAGVTGGSGLLAKDNLALVAPNLRISLDVFEASKKYGVGKVIVMSSTTGYPDRQICREDDYFNGDVASCYSATGETKRFIERLGRMYPFESVWLRCPGVYGPGDDYSEDGHVIAATIRKVAEKHDPIVCWGDGEDRRDGVYIEEFVDACQAALYAKGAFNIATGRDISINRMIEVLCEHRQIPMRVKYVPGPHMIRTRLLDTQKAHQELHWQAQTTIEAGLCRTLDEYLRLHP